VSRADVLRAYAVALCVVATTLSACSKPASELVPPTPAAPSSASAPPARPAPVAEPSSVPGRASAAAAGQILVAKFEPFESDPQYGRVPPSLASPHYDRLIDASRIVLRASSATLVIDYPLHRAARFQILPDAPDAGFSVRGIVRAVAEKYAQVYAEEKASASKPIANIPGMMNRAESDGKYGIWGHNLDDLVLEAVDLRTENGAVLVELEVGS
jgi:hypothetical protein